MEKFPFIKKDNELDAYYHSEDLYNTDFAAHESLDIRRPDAYIDFGNSMFFNPQSLLVNLSDGFDPYSDI